MANRSATPSGTPRWIGIGLAAAIAVLLLIVIINPFDRGSSAGPDDPEAAETTLRLQGSNTIGSELAPDLAEAFLTARGAADVRRVSGDGLVTVSGTLAGAPGASRSARPAPRRRSTGWRPGRHRWAWRRDGSPRPR